MVKPFFKGVSRKYLNEESRSHRDPHGEKTQKNARIINICLLVC